MRNYQYKQETMQPFKQLAFKFNASARIVHELAPTEAYATAPIKFKGVRIGPRGFQLFSCNGPFNNIANPRVAVTLMCFGRIYGWECAIWQRGTVRCNLGGWSWKPWRDFFFLHTFKKKRMGQRGRIKTKSRHIFSPVLHLCDANHWAHSTVARTDWTGQNLTPFIVFCCGVPGMQEP